MEVLDLSERSLAAQERQAEVQMQVCCLCAHTTRIRTHSKLLGLWAVRHSPGAHRIVLTMWTAACVQLEVARRARGVHVPTNPKEVQLKLRELGEPICLFGERAGDRRERLRQVVARRAMESEGETVRGLPRKSRVCRPPGASKCAVYRVLCARWAFIWTGHCHREGIVTARGGPETKRRPHGGLLLRTSDSKQAQGHAPEACRVLVSACPGAHLCGA